MITYFKTMAVINVLGMLFALYVGIEQVFKLHLALALFFIFATIAKEYDRE